LSALRDLVQNPPSDQNDEVTAALSALLVIRSSGYLEQVVIESLRAYTHSKSIPRVSSYAISWVSTGLNPRPRKLEEFVRRMDGDWSAELVEFFDADDQRLRREIALLVDRRNKLAHGQAEGVGATKAVALSDDAVTVADWFLNRYDPR
jgi:hypothetical protein